MSENYLLIGAALVASCGAVCDLRSARIPNRFTYSALLSGLLLRLTAQGGAGLKSGAVGMLAAGGLFVVLFVIGAMGGGDVKLMAAVGAWAGAGHVLSVLIAAALAGGALAIIYMLFGQGLRSTGRNLLALMQFRLTSGLLPHPVLNVHEPGTLRVPFGVAVAIGTLFCAANVILWR